MNTTSLTYIARTQTRKCPLQKQFCHLQTELNRKGNQPSKDCKYHKHRSWKSFDSQYSLEYRLSNFKVWNSWIKWILNYMVVNVFLKVKSKYLIWKFHILRWGTLCNCIEFFFSFPSKEVFMQIIDSWEQPPAHWIISSSCYFHNS